jgi:hypothetical protein
MYYQVNSPRIVHEYMDGEVIAIDFETGGYFSLREVAAYIWNLLAAGIDSDVVCARLAREFQLEMDAVTGDTAAFIAYLTDNHLVRESASPVSTDMQPPDPRPPRYTTPTVEKFTDMEQLLLLDPIHEVDEVAGWPAKK